MFKTRIIVTAVLLAPFTASPQNKISVGVVGGYSLTDGFHDRFLPSSYSIPGYESPFTGIRHFSQAKDYLMGGMVELSFDPHWSVEVDGLFRKLHMTWAAVMKDGTLNSVSPSPVITWEFPVLAKYRFSGGRVKPFLEAGPSFRTAGNLNGSNPSRYGATAGLGVEIPWHGFKIAPTVRYTRWAKDNEAQQRYGPLTAPNQVELLVGFSRQAHSNLRPAGSWISLGVIMGTNVTGDFPKTVLPTGGGNLIGTPPLDMYAVSHTDSSGPRSFIVGPRVEFHLPRHLSIEIDAMYRPVSRTSDVAFSNGTRFKNSYRFVTWEFPVLPKYSFNLGRIKPFVGVGPSFRLPQALTLASPYGVVAAAGLEFRVQNHLKVSPSFRYTHWAQDDRVAPGNPRRNQCEALVGFSF